MSDKIELLPGANLTPDVALHLCLERRIPDTKSVIVITMGNDDRVEVSQSRMSMADMSFMLLKFQMYVTAVLSGIEP